MASGLVSIFVNFSGDQMPKNERAAMLEAKLTKPHFLPDLTHHAQARNLTRKLIERGFSDEQIEKILRGQLAARFAPDTIASRAYDRAENHNFIDGEFVEPVGGKYLDNIEPATGNAYSQVADSDAAMSNSRSPRRKKLFPVGHARRRRIVRAFCCALPI